MKRAFLSLMCVLLPSLGTAQVIYKCADASGGTVFSNTRLDKNCKAVASSPENTLPAPKAKSSAAATPTPGSFPRVPEETQKARDGDRRHILEQELAGEQRNLEQARKDLAEQEAARATPDRLAPYRDRVAQHERNIAALQKELGGLR